MVLAACEKCSALMKNTTNCFASKAHENEAVCAFAIANNTTRVLLRCEKMSSSAEVHRYGVELLRQSGLRKSWKNQKLI